MKTLILQWIIEKCDSDEFLGMKWENREEGIFWLYWKHQSSRICRENNAESAALYEYYRAWARHKNREDGRRQARDLKAAFRNALEKKTKELERLTHMDTKERIFWRFKCFPNAQNETCASTQSSSKKSKGISKRGRKPSTNLVQNGSEFPINFGASTSSTSEDILSERRKPRKYTKGGQKISAKAKKTFTDEEVVSSSCDPTMRSLNAEQEDASNQPSLPPFVCFKRSDHDNGSWEGSFKNTDSNFSAQPTQFSETLYEQTKTEDVWTPQFLSQVTPPHLSADLMEVSSTEFMDLLVPNQNINYSFQPTPPPEPTDILFDDFTDADLMNLGKIINGGEPTILKYSFPFQPEEVLTSRSHLTNLHTHQPPATSLHYCPSDFESMTKISNVQNNNRILDSTATPVNAFDFDQRTCSYDQVVPPYCEAFQNSQQVVNTSEIFVNDCVLYSPQSVTNHGQIPDEPCYQQADTGCQSVELFRYNNQTSHDDSGIGDMEDFLDCANKLLDNIDFHYNEQSHQML